MKKQEFNFLKVCLKDKIMSITTYTKNTQKEKLKGHILRDNL